MMRLMRRFRVQRYRDPSLHPGVWGPPQIEPHNGQTVIVWRNYQHTICAGSNHGVKVCRIGPGMAHEDTCLCGAKRYGVFGVWS
jgi:hypothetical protein